MNYRTCLCLSQCCVIRMKSHTFDLDLDLEVCSLPSTIPFPLLSQPISILFCWQKHTIFSTLQFIDIWTVGLKPAGRFIAQLCAKLLQYKPTEINGLRWEWLRIGLHCWVNSSPMKQWEVEGTPLPPSLSSLPLGKWLSFHGRWITSPFHYQMTVAIQLLTWYRTGSRAENKERGAWVLKGNQKTVQSSAEISLLQADQVEVYCQVPTSCDMPIDNELI